MKRNVPNAMKKPRTLTASDALNARERNSDRSINGSVNLFCRRRNTLPVTKPATMVNPGSKSKSLAAILLIP